MRATVTDALGGRSAANASITLSPSKRPTPVGLPESTSPTTTRTAGGGLHYYNLVISHALPDANAKRLPSGDQRGILARERIEPDAVSSAAFGGRRKPVLTTCTSRLG